LVDEADDVPGVREQRDARAGQGLEARVCVHDDQ
jgi:hypothetical protein